MNEGSVLSVMFYLQVGSQHFTTELIRDPLRVPDQNQFQYHWPFGMQHSIMIVEHCHAHVE